MTQQSRDRYVSFQGLDCDQKARQVVDFIEQYVAQPPHPSRWLEYFQMKLANRQALGQDELYFVGSQVNAIRSLFAEYQNEVALTLLEQVEEECC